MKNTLEQQGKIKVAVWGTLRTGESNNALMQFVEPLGLDEIPYYRKHGLTLIQDNESSVPVEVYEVSQNHFDDLNKFEEYFGYYARLVELKSGDFALVWMN